MEDYPKTTREKFEKWCNATDTINSQDTINTYWTNLEKIPEFSLQPLKSIEKTQRKDTNADTVGEAHREELMGRIDRKVDKKMKLQAVRNLIKCKLWYIKKDDSIKDNEYTRIKMHTNEILDYIDLDKTEGKTRQQKIEYHYIHKDDMVALLRRAEPFRARYWVTTYLLGVRWFASKTLTDKHFFRSRKENGVVRIPEERTKSQDSRDIELYSDWFWKLIDSAPQGDWTDRHNRTWKDVYFPDIKQSSENYQLGQKKNGKVYGLVGEIGLSPRTIHSFRHTRITDLIKAESKQLKEVQDRAGHTDTSSTNHYSDTKFSKEPKSLEQYCRENDIDLLEVVNNEP